MQRLDQKQIDTLLEDISTRKTVINKNRSVLQQVFHPARFRWFMLAAGLCIVCYSLAITLGCGILIFAISGFLSKEED